MYYPMTSCDSTEGTEADVDIVHNCMTSCPVDHHVHDDVTEMTRDIPIVSDDDEQHTF